MQDIKIAAAEKNIIKAKTWLTKPAAITITIKEIRPKTITKFFMIFIFCCYYLKQM